jgi:hypothetical protein
MSTIGLGKILILAGALLITVGLVLVVLQKTSFLGRLPGDIVIKREHFTIYIPLATSIVVSIIISLILFLVGKCR